MALDLNKIRAKRKEVLGKETKQSLQNWYYKRRLESMRNYLGEGEMDFVVCNSSTFKNTTKALTVEDKEKTGESNYTLAA